MFTYSMAWEPSARWRGRGGGGKTGESGPEGRREAPAEAAMEAEADTPTGEDGAVAELRALLSVA